VSVVREAVGLQVKRNTLGAPLDMDENEVRSQRPPAVTVLGRLFLSLAVFASLAFLAVSVIAALAAGNGELPLDMSGLPPMFGPLAWAMTHLLVIALVQLAVSLFGAYGAWAFLQLRRWARAYFEALLWLCVAGNVALAAWWVLLNFAYSAPVAATGGPHPTGLALPAVLVLEGLVALLLNASVHGVVLWLMRSRYVLPAFTSASAASGS
jgi:hypothetical protein